MADEAKAVADDKDPAKSPKAQRADQTALEEEQRRQKSSVVDLAREDGMKGNAPGGATVEFVNKPENKEDK